MNSDSPGEYQLNGLIPPNQILPEGVHRIAAAVEYDGSSVCGWQRQAHSPSVQQHVEEALSAVAAEPVRLVCAGRTDTGVHATNQVVHFDTQAVRMPRNWILGANANLPDSIRLHWAEEVGPQFHARFSALSRTYRYLIANQPYRPGLFQPWLTWEKRPLDAEVMHRAAQNLLGEHDFSSFRAAGCQSNSPNRNVEQLKVWRQGELVVVEIRANAFLYHMVRNIVGALMQVGFGEYPPEWLAELLGKRDRTVAPATSRSNGLYLVNVEYPEKFNIPAFTPGPKFIS